MFRKRNKTHGQVAEPKRKLDLTEIFDLIKAYARQELLEPLSFLPRWLGLGLAGSIAHIIGTILLMLALLRALQTETGTALSGNLSWIPYVIAVVCLLLVVTILLRQIYKRSLQ